MIFWRILGLVAIMKMSDSEASQIGIFLGGTRPGKLTDIAMERSTIFNGKIHYFYGHVPLQTVSLPEGKLCKTSNAHCSIRSCRPRGEVKTTSRQGKQCAAERSQFGGALSDPCNSLRLTTGQCIKTYQDISRHIKTWLQSTKHIETQN